MSTRLHLATIGEATLVLVIEIDSVHRERVWLEGWVGSEMRYSEPLSNLTKAVADHAEKHHAAVRATWTMEQWHKAQLHPDWEYRCVVTGRKDGQDGRPEGDGWEPNNHVLGGDCNWERHDYTEDNYWMRPRTSP